MSKSFKAVGSIGAVALILSSAATAVITDAEMDQWSVTNGTISADCQDANGGGTWNTCAGALVDKGFYQRMITKMDGGEEITFFQTIITEDNATASKGNLDTLVFSDESFVRTGNVGGIKDKQRISQSVVNNGTTATYTHFKASTLLGTGWAGGASGDTLMLKQTLIDDADNFQTDFTFKQIGTATNTVAKAMRITAYVPIEQGDDQDFTLISLEGDYNAADGQVVLTGPNNPGTMTWTGDTSLGDSAPHDGDHIQAIWIGQSLNTILGQRFGFVSFENRDTQTNNYVSSFSLVDEDPNKFASWDTNVWGDRVTRGSIFELISDTPPFNMP